MQWHHIFSHAIVSHADVIGFLSVVATEPTELICSVRRTFRDIFQYFN